MKRDMELIRKTLFKIEEEVGTTVKFNIEIEGYTMDQVAYHCSLLYDGGLIKDYKAQYGSGELSMFSVSGLTWKGHEFLDTIRNDTVWKKTKDTIVKRGLSTTVEVIKNVATEFLSILTKSAIEGLTK